jgi:hypothetical protein
MTIFADLQVDIVGTTTLSSVLRRAKVLAYRLQDSDFKNWVDFELDGYYGHTEQLPEYRTFQTASFGTFRNMAWMQKNVPIPIEMLPGDIQQYVAIVRMFQGVRELESMIESMDREGTDHLQDLWPAGSEKLLGADGGYYCMSAWRLLPRSRIAQILDTVRTRLLTFSLELGERYPKAAALDFNAASENPPAEQVRYVFHMYVTGSANISQGVTMNTFNQNVQNQHVNHQYNAAGDINFAGVQDQVGLVTQLEKLQAEVSRAGQAGVIDEESFMDTEYQLKKVVQEAKKPQPDKQSLLQRIQDATILIGGIAAASDLVKGFAEAAQTIQRLLP